MAYSVEELEKILRGESDDEIFNQAAQNMEPVHINISPKEDSDEMLDPRLPEKKKTPLPKIEPMDKSARLVEDTKESTFDAIPSRQPAEDDFAKDFVPEEDDASTEAPSAEKMSDLDKLRSEVAKRKRMLKIFRGLSKLGQSHFLKYNPNINVKTPGLDQEISEANQPVEDYLSDQKRARQVQQEELMERLKKVQIGKNEFEFANLEKTSDPASKESEFARNRVKQVLSQTGRPTPPEIDQMSAKDLHAEYEFLQKDLEMIYKNKSLEARKEIAAKRVEAAGKRAAASAERQERFNADRNMRSKRNLDERRESRMFREKEGEKERTRKINKDIQGLVSQYKNDKVVSELRKQDISFEQAEGLMSAMDNNNAMAYGPLGTKMARAMGEVGVLTDADVIRYISTEKVSDRARNWFSAKLQGKPSDLSQKDLKDIVNIMRMGATKRINNIKEEYFNRAYKAYGEPAGYSMDDVRKQFGTKIAAPTNMVKMKVPGYDKPKMIPRDQVEAAKKAGAEEF